MATRQFPVDRQLDLEDTPYPLHLKCYPRHKLGFIRTQGSLSGATAPGTITAVEFHNALQSRHGYGSQTPDSS